MKHYLFTSALFSLLLSNNVKSQNNEKSEVFLPNIISSGYNERDMAISPDGKEMFYTLVAPRNAFTTIVRLTKVNNKWSEVAIAPFSGQYPDLEPAFSPDGKRLYFASKRPVKINEPKDDYDIWYVEKKDKSWSDPIHAGNVINTAADEFYPSVTNDGSVYFTASRKDGFGGEDIYKSVYSNGAFQPAVSIGGGVSTKLNEFNAFIDPAEKYIIFTAMNGAGDIGRGDLYISFRNTEGVWAKTKNLGAGINSSRLDYCPFIQNGILYFTSERVLLQFDGSKKLSLKEVKTKMDSWGNGWGDIYSINIDKLFLELTNK